MNFRPAKTGKGFDERVVIQLNSNYSHITLHPPEGRGAQ